MFQPDCDYVETLNQNLESRVVEHLSEYNAAVLPRLRIMAQRGTVTLRGDVESRATARAIMAIARRVPGVQRVIDEMEAPRARHADSWQTPRYQFSPALARYFEERRQGLVSDSAIVWDA